MGEVNSRSCPSSRMILAVGTWTILPEVQLPIIVMMVMIGVR